MEIAVWIIFGALVGLVASFIMRSGGGIIHDIVVGIIGSILGGFIMNFIGQRGVGGFNIYSFVVAIIGACVLIFVVRTISK